MRRPSRFWPSLYVPIAMRVPCQAIVVPPRRFFEAFDIPRRCARNSVLARPTSRQALRDTFGDVRATT